MKLPAAVFKVSGNKESRRSAPKVYEFKGLNNNAVIQPGQLKAMSNCGSDNFPCISNRAARTQITTITTPVSLFSANGSLAYVDGTSFKYNDTVKGTVTLARKSMTEISYYNVAQQRQESLIFIFPDKKYYNITTNTFGDIGSGTYPAAGSCPDMDYVCSYANRVFGVKNNNIYASRYNNPFDWTTFTINGFPTSETAYAQYTVGMDSFTGIVAYSMHVTMFKADSMFELYGDNATNFYNKEVAKKGCVDNRSIREVNGLLYFLSRDGYNSYGGGVPRLISKELNETYASASAGSDNSKYYTCLYNGTSYNVYVYDTYYGVWHKEDALRITEFTTMGGSVYALTNESTSKIMRFKFGTETISWSAETEIFDEHVLNKKYYSKLMAKVELEAGSTMNVYIKVDSGTYELITTLTATSLQVISKEFQPRKCNNFQVKFSGTGAFKIYTLERQMEVTSDR